MKKFKIVTKSVTVENYIVEAETENEACDLVSMGEIKPIKKEEIDLDFDTVEEIK